MTKLVLTCSRYRLPTEDGKPGRLVYVGDEFETTAENAERLIKANAAEPVKAAAKPKVEDPPPVDPDDKTKSTPKAGAK